MVPENGGCVAVDAGGQLSLRPLQMLLYQLYEVWFGLACAGVWKQLALEAFVD